MLVSLLYKVLNFFYHDNRKVLINFLVNHFYNAVKKVCGMKKNYVVKLAILKQIK